MDKKLWWLYAVKTTFHLPRELANVKLASVTSQFVYISKKLQDIIGRVMSE